MKRSTNDPLGLAKGSVRAIIALEVVTVLALMGLGALFIGLNDGKLDPTPVVTGFLALGNMIAGFYFITRQNGGQTE